MSKFDNPLENIRIASPCSADWEQMYGDERKRFCGDCKLYVYNLSAMTRPEAERFIQASEGRLCVRFFARPDGTVITEDCPVGWAKFKRRTRMMATAFASLVAALFAGIFAVALFANRSERQVVGELVPYATPTPVPKTSPSPVPLMGAVAVPPRKNNSDQERPLMGKPMMPQKGN